jgi:hypothetical protein
VCWVVDVLHFFLDLLLGVGLWVGVFAVVGSLVRLAGFIRRRLAFRSAVVTPSPSWTPPPSWSLTLLVEVDDDAGLFRPSVQLRGSELPVVARLRLELVDESGSIRVSTETRLLRSAIGREVALPAFSAPDGVAVEHVLQWHWDVVLEDSRGERKRWREHPAPAGALNDEAELELPGVAEI